MKAFKLDLRKIGSLIGLSLILLVTVGCAKEGSFINSPTGSSDGNTKDKNEDVEETIEVSVGRIALDWGLQEFLFRGYLSLGFGYTEAPYQEQYCFENNNPCRRASSAVRTEILNNPVAIQAFQLNIGLTAAQTFELQAASVTTAEIQFNGGDGSLVFKNRHAREFVSGVSCSLEGTENVNNVGFAPAPIGSERVLTGLYVYDGGVPDTEGTNINNVYATSVRVEYSGLKPTVSSDPEVPFAFSFAPAAAADQVDFGKDPFTSTSTATLAVSPKFGLDPAYAASVGITSGVANHVIIGFCIQAVKRSGTGASSTVLPAVHGTKIRTYRPGMFLKSTSS